MRCPQLHGGLHSFLVFLSFSGLSLVVSLRLLSRKVHRLLRPRLLTDTSS